MSFHDDMPITVQPSMLTYNNIASVCALATIPRVSVDTDTGVNSYWASNDWVEQRLRSIFVNMQKQDYNEKIESVDIYPIIYAVSEQEKESMRNVMEIEGKSYLSGVALIFNSKKGWAEDISLTKIRKIDWDKCHDIQYGIFIDQSMDGNPYQIQELILMILTTGFNQYRRINFVPHEKMPINVKMAYSVLDNIKFREDVVLEDKIDAVTQFIKAHLSGSDNPEALAVFDRLNPEYEEYNGEDKIAYTFVDDRTELKADRNLPHIYKEIWEAYRNSFDSNRYPRML